MKMLYQEAKKLLLKFPVLRTEWVGAVMYASVQGYRW